MDTQYAVYLGHEQQNGFTGFLSEKGFYCAVEIFDGYTQEQGEALMGALSEVQKAAFDSLVGFDSAIAGILKRLNVPLDTSIAIGYMRQNILYLKTGGTGEIYLHRGKATERILFGDNIASGKVAEHDLVVFTTSFFTESLKGIHTLKTLVHTKNPLQDYPEHIKQSLDQQDDTGAIALFIQFIATPDTYATPQAYTEQAQPKKFKLPTLNIAPLIWLSRQKKGLVGAALILCFLILAWNMRGALNSHPVSSFTTKMQEVTTLVNTASGQTDTIDQAMATLTQAEEGYTLLAHMSESKDRQTDLANLQTRITTLKNTVLKREQKDTSEFFDLTVEEKTAQASVCSLVGTDMLLLNPTGTVYRLSLDKKSLTKQKLVKAVSSDALVAGYDKNTYIFDAQQGILRLDADGKQTTVIKADTAWGTMGGMELYNGNIYLLDRDSGGVIKYAGIPDGFGDKVAYFQGSHDPTDALSTLAIDSSIYVSTASTVTKYTAGLKDTFTFKLPEQANEIAKVIAHKDDANLYIWDKKMGALLVYTKDGLYTKQVTNDAFKTATDVEVYNTKAFLLVSPNILSIDL